ncbi:HD domain-containing protein [Rickettsia bellii]|uniref:Guanosine polyphosphate pyrophosphohydrolase/synthetase n=2 Tax=Rickettsia bellii TaxID=33990 RepID=Q1RJ19_RICBR|nr:HD domain-containing protein [Rickettsia bellii]ABE04645.1 Guanosine polyphosphate pyrophosphohydrolase/synthetase [Rickettsia bellii RML369-C]ABV79006.1 Guanosine polyphosphate pyrophosphohydrolase/synthetase [Rickettsia bellii OSU 85-389]KJV89426.1 HD domain protein [Rickettsia bellii str. RML An4]
MEDLSSWKERFEECIYAKKLLDKLHYLNTKVVNPINLEEIKKGIYYARKYHGLQMRKSGDPYYSHPIEVAIMVAEFTAAEVPKLYTSVMIQAALLHDTIEDTALTEEMIAKIFGEEVAKHVEGLTRVKPYGKITAEESLNILVKQKRYDTVLIKLFDRIHNVQTLGAKSPEKQIKILTETLKNFIVLASYLELFEIEAKLMKYCLKLNSLKSNLQTAQNLQNSCHNYSFQTFSSLAFQNDLFLKQNLYWLKSL